MNIRINPKDGSSTIVLTKTERGVLSRARDLCRVLGAYSGHCKIMTASFKELEDSIDEDGTFNVRTSDLRNSKKGDAEEA